jgi:hypothetical protein
MDEYVSKWVVTWLKTMGKAVWLEREAVRLGRHEDAARLRTDIAKYTTIVMSVIRRGLEEYSENPQW